MLAAAVFAHTAGAQNCEWVTFPSGLSGGAGVPTVDAIGVFDDGGGPAVYVSGTFTMAGGMPADRLAKWDGTSWSAFGNPTSSVLTFYVREEGGNPVMYMGGGFTSIGGISALRIARWTGQAGGWSALGTGANSLGVYSMVSHDDGSGPALFVGGGFTTAGGVAGTARIGRWDGASWSELDGGMDNRVWAVASFNGDLYAAGTFTTAGNVPASLIARWDGTSWSPLGSGITGSGAPAVRAMKVYDDGNGPALYIGGAFNAADGLPVNRIVKWDGQSFSALGAGVGSSVAVMNVFDDGSGPALYVGGMFTSAGGNPAVRIARWDGTSWSALGTGVGSSATHQVTSITPFNDGSGPALFVGGSFTVVGTEPSQLIARWQCEPVVQPCYANCDGSTVEPVLNVEDFTCFINEFAIGSSLPPAQQTTHYANCDGSTTEPALNVEDFTCFINAFAQGCP